MEELVRYVHRCVPLQGCSLQRGKCTLMLHGDPLGPLPERPDTLRLIADVTDVCFFPLRKTEGFWWRPRQVRAAYRVILSWVPARTPDEKEAERLLREYLTLLDLEADVYEAVDQSAGRIRRHVQFDEKTKKENAPLVTTP